MADHPDSGTRAGGDPHGPSNSGQSPQPGDPRDPRQVAADTSSAARDVGPSSPPTGHPLAAAAGRETQGPAPVVRHGYEHSDVNIKPLVVTALILIVGGVIVHLVLWALFAVFEQDEKAQPENQQRSLVARTGDRFPTGTSEQTPPLQGIPGFHVNAPSIDMDEQRRANDAILDNYGWTNQPGVARIPIERAMELSLERGLFAGGATTRPTTAPASAGPEGRAR